MAHYNGNIYSESTGLTTQLVVVVPDFPHDIGPELEGKPPKVLYLLHGGHGNAADWTRLTRAEYYAKKYNYVLIMPEVQLSFYSNTAYGAAYYDYVAYELPEIIEKTFNFPKGRENTYIAGLSMGGYGTLKIGFGNYKNYAGIASFSALTDINNFLDVDVPRIDRGSSIDLFKGVFGADMKIDKRDDPFELIADVANKPDRPMHLQTCGTDDFLYNDNQKWRKKLDDLGYGHTYLEWKDGHTWPFWDRSLELAMRFFGGEDVSESNGGSFQY